MKYDIKNYGFVKPQIDDTHFVFGSARSLGALGKIVLQADGQWDKYLPIYEPQFSPNGWDTYGCTVWGTENAIEIMIKKIFGFEANYSERYIYNLVPVRPPGADPHQVAETIRNKGLVDQDLLPMTETFQEFMQPTPMTQTFLGYGQKWLLKYGFGHQWVFSTPQNRDKRIALMKENLKYSPLGVSVTAWIENDNGIYIDDGQPNRHWPVCFGWDDDKQAWKIFDSYDQSVKLYSFDSAIDFCKSYALTALSQASSSVIPVVKKNEYWFVNLLKAIVNLFFPTWKQ